MVDMVEGAAKNHHSSAELAQKWKKSNPHHRNPPLLSLSLLHSSPHRRKLAQKLRLIPQHENLLIDPVLRILTKLQVETQKRTGKHQPHLMPRQIPPQACLLIDLSERFASRGEEEEEEEEQASMGHDSQPFGPTLKGSKAFL